jgi:hypothetical protein
MDNKFIVLIVEDKLDVSTIYATHCKLAVAGMRAKGINIEAEVIQAFNLEQAIRIIESREVDFVSLDLALDESESNLDGSDRYEGKEAGGILFLKGLRERGKHPNVIVVSGETSLPSSYAEDSSIYGVLRYFTKSKIELDPIPYHRAVQSAIWYKNALNTISRLEEYEGNPEEIHQAQKYWENSLQAAQEAQINAKNYADPTARIMAIRNKLDRDTSLPLNEWVERAFVKSLIQQPAWSLLRVEVKNSDAFDKTHPSQVSPLSVYIAQKLQELSQKLSFAGPFIGKYRLGHREFFIVIFQSNIRDRATAALDWLQDIFKEDASKFTPQLVVEKNMENVPVVIPELDVKLWYSDAVTFYDTHQIIDALGTQSL